MLLVIARRLVQAVVLVFVIVTFVFFFLRLAPGDPVTLLAPQGTDEAKAVLRAELGIDKPILVQYGVFLRDILLHGDFGESFFFPGKAVFSLVTERIGLTLLLTGIAIFTAIAVSFPLGVLAATRRNSIWDRLALVVAMGFQSAPNFWLGMVFLIIFSVKLRLLPAVGFRDVRYAILPGLALSLALIAALTRIIRTVLIDVLQNEYMRAAIARGIPMRMVIWKHGLKSIMVPMVTVLAAQTGYLLGGAVVIEFVFNYPGLGLLTLNAALRRDYALIQALAAVMALIFVLMNLMVDIVYGVIDPRMRRAI
jgi:peptide/nickel transport system permease protein